MNTPFQAHLYLQHYVWEAEGELFATKVGLAIERDCPGFSDSQAVTASGFLFKGFKNRREGQDHTHSHKDQCDEEGRAQIILFVLPDRVEQGPAD